MKKYGYDGNTYDTYDEAREAAIKDFDEFFGQAMMDYFDFHPSVVMQMLDELSYLGSPLWEGVLEDAVTEYLENGIEDWEEN